MAVIQAYFKQNHLGSLAEEIHDVVYSYSGKISLAEALGVLEIVKHELLTQHNDESEAL